jgi:hypothetical protein
MDFSFFSPENIPPEIIETIRRQHDLGNMEAEDAVHRRQEFLDGLDEEQLLALRSLLAVLASDSTIATYLLGTTSAMLRLRFGLCGCGSKHDSTAHVRGLEDVQLPPDPPDDGPTYDSAELISGELVRDADKNRTWRENIPLSLLAAYSLEIHTPVEGIQSLVCSGCGIVQVSLEDRLSRAPGVKGCSTCQQQAKWG